MKFTLATLFAAVVAVASASPAPKDITPGAIKADSKLGKRVLSHARRLDDQNQNNNQNENQEIDFGWVAEYSIKFQGCHHINQWNEEADGEDDPFIQTKRLVRFRLCPTETCTYEDAGGCDEGYGDYIIDMNIFLENYWQDKLDNCENYAAYTCNCENANNQEYCEYDCLMDAGMDYCVDENPYQQDNGDNGNEDEYEEIEVEQAMECAQWDIDENAYYNYQYNNNNNNNANDANRRKLEEEVQYFIGPYCSDQGGKIFLGVFTDEFCTNFADNQDGEGSSHTEFYYKMTGGHSLPYASESLVDMDCVSCKEPSDQDQNNNNDNQDADEVKEAWETVYASAGKCESQLDNAYLYYPNENACNYIEGIKIVRKDGIVVQGAAAKSKTAAIFIGIFSVSFVLLGAYVYYLKTKLDRAKINLSE